MKISFDPSKCTGCMACQMACLDQRDIDCKNGQKPLRYVEAREDGLSVTFHSIGCIHCGGCISACPMGCIGRDENGLVQIMDDSCIGCGSCVSTCPLSVISLSPATGRAMKCDGCAERIKAGLLPACVHTCPTGALALKP